MSEADYSKEQQQGTQPPDCYPCFISYSHKDMTFAELLYYRLTARGIQCWKDNKDYSLPQGADVYDAIGHGIHFWDKVILCCSEHSLTSWWVNNELTTALDKEQKLTRERGQRTLLIIPLDLDGYLRDKWQDGRAGIIRARVAGDFKGWQDPTIFDAQFERLVRALCAQSELPPPPRSKLLPKP